MWFIVRNKWEHWRTSTRSDRISRKQRITKHLFNISVDPALSFITSQGHQFTSPQRQMQNQFKLRIQNNSFSMARVLRGWNVWWKWHGGGASQGHRQRNNYANFPPLCLTSNNTALYICKDWQDAACTHTLLSERSHGRAVTPKWVTSVSNEATGPDFTLNSDKTCTQTLAKVTTCGTHCISRVKRHRALKSPSVPWKVKKLNNLISGGFIIPAEVKSTWLALWIYSAVGLFGHH